MCASLVHEFNPWPLWNRSIIVFTTQDPAAERWPNSGAHSSALKKRLVLSFESFANKHIILTLFHYRGVKAKSLSDLACLLKVNRRPLRGTPVQRQAIVNQPTEGSYLFFKWSAVVGTMRKDDIHILELHSFQWVSCSLDDSLSWQANVVNVHWTSDKLCAYHKVLSWHIKGFQGNTHLRFCGSKCVHLSCVEVVYAGVIAFTDTVSYQLLAFFIVLICGQPVTIGKNWDFHSSVAQVPVGHLAFADLPVFGVLCSEYHKRLL